jgi:hypothetical protein
LVSYDLDRAPFLWAVMAHLGDGVTMHSRLMQELPIGQEARGRSVREGGVAAGTNPPLFAGEVAVLISSAPEVQMAP